MGIYLNPDNRDYEKLINSRIVVDKSLLIEKTNEVLNTSSSYLCVSRPRRFGKSTDANMLVAYYSKGCDSHSLFGSLKIAEQDDYEKHLNKHNVIHINMQNILSKTKDMDQLISLLSRLIIRDLKRAYKDVDYFDDTNLQLSLADVYGEKHERFIFIIDEWDCLFREFRQDVEAQRQYLDFLRDMFKDQAYVEMVYMTGILPIKKYGTHSALNMFNEVSMINPRDYSQFMGFLEEEVKELCEQYQVDFNRMREWYNGYHLANDVSIYSPRSVTCAIELKQFDNYWSQTETFEALQDYIDLNFEGLKDDIIAMIANEKCNVNIRTFQNDMSTFHSKDDVYTLLIHLGYLGYDANEKKVYIPNNEVKDTFVDSISVSNWGVIQKVFQNANALLEATWKRESDKVAKYIQESHYETSILQYNDENALAYTIYLAYITAKEHYTVIREMPSGKGFADIVFIPKKDEPAMIIELKYDKDAESGITQIRNKEYPRILEKYLDDLLMVSINYDKQTKDHQCIIEKYE